MPRQSSRGCWRSTPITPVRCWDRPDARVSMDKRTRWSWRVRPSRSIRSWSPPACSWPSCGSSSRISPRRRQRPSAPSRSTHRPWRRYRFWRPSGVCGATGRASRKRGAECSRSTRVTPISTRGSPTSALAIDCTAKRWSSHAGRWSSTPDRGAGMPSSGSTSCGWAPSTRVGSTWSRRLKATLTISGPRTRSICSTPSVSTPRCAPIGSCSRSIAKRRPCSRCI